MVLWFLYVIDFYLFLFVFIFRGNLWELHGYAGRGMEGDEA